MKNCKDKKNETAFTKNMNNIPIMTEIIPMITDKYVKAEVSEKTMPVHIAERPKHTIAKPITIENSTDENTG